jgi:hypothetical protein
MRKLLPLLLAGLFVAPPLMSQAAPPSADEQALRGIETEIAKLKQQNDSTFAKFFAKDWICLGPTRVLSKSEFVENVRLNFITHERAVNPCTVEKKNMQVHVFGDTAVVLMLRNITRRRTPQNSSTKTIRCLYPRSRWLASAVCKSRASADKSCFKLTFRFLRLISSFEHSTVNYSCPFLPGPGADHFCPCQYPSTNDASPPA